MRHFGEMSHTISFLIGSSLLLLTLHLQLLIAEDPGAGYTGRLKEKISHRGEPKTSKGDYFRTVTEMIESRGFGVDEHYIVTEDGYVLLLHRIINPMVPEYRRHELPPVILQHGLLSNQVDFVVSSRDVRPVDPFMMRRKYANDQIPELDEVDVKQLDLDTQEHPNALAFYLANRGYDVFLSSSRGSTYGTQHIKYKTSMGKFWDFSFDELIKYDLPAVIDHVRSETGYPKVGYVGHSQGSIIMFGLLADRPEYADIVEPFIALAPVAYVHSGTSPAKHLFKHTPNLKVGFVRGHRILGFLLYMFTQPMAVRKHFVARLIHLIVGKNMEELDMKTLPARMAHMPGGSSFKNIKHYGQEAKSGRFCKFDYKPKKNMEKYGQETPPAYDIGKIRSRSVVLFTADNDRLSHPDDIARLISEFKVPLYRRFHMTQALPKYNHVDFVYGKHCGQLINRRVANVLDQFNNYGYGDHDDARY